jgi:hypothetical protein
MRSHARFALCAAALAAALSPSADALAGPDSLRTTFLLSRSYQGGLPNGPSRNGAISHDQRIARVMAFESDASDIVQGDANGHTDVFVVHRAEPWGVSGTEWNIGAIEIASTGPGSAPANCRSYRPVLDGDSRHAPSCIAFVSDASNLVPGDTNGKPDAFVRDLRSGRVERVSVDAKGRQANGATSEVAVNGDCERVAFVSDASNLALGKTKRRAWSTARTSRTRLGVRQVYVRIRGGSGRDGGFKGMTFLASASDLGKAANAGSYDVDFGRAGKAVVFTSEATNLDRGDGGTVPDVYQRAFIRKFQHLGHGKGVQALAFDTRLVSAKPDGRAGNGASSKPSVSDDGHYVAFETLAADLLPSDSNGVSDVAEADMAGRVAKQRWVSRSPFSGIGNGASNRPVISGAGEFVLFDSEATNLKPSASVNDSNGVRDVFLWNRPSGNVALESRDSENGNLASASQNPATSSRGNYVPFESAYPLIDLPLAPTLLAGVSSSPASTVDPSLIPALIDPDAITAGVAASGAANPALQQVYVRYLGPK